jgi:predicted Zn-ribbon and HTH transcriptional regulator
VPSSQSQPGPERIITSANNRDDVAQILYGLSIRGVKASTAENTDRNRTSTVPGSRPDRFLIVLNSESTLQRQIADESIEAIWDAILEGTERAVTPSGHCSFCGYDIARLPRPTVCPECGVNVDSIEARRAIRDRRL